MFTKNDRISSSALTRACSSAAGSLAAMKNASWASFIARPTAGHAPVLALSLGQVELPVAVTLGSALQDAVVLSERTR